MSTVLPPRQFGPEIIYADFECKSDKPVDFSQDISLFTQPRIAICTENGKSVIVYPKHISEYINLPSTTGITAMLSDRYCALLYEILADISLGKTFRRRLDILNVVTLNKYSLAFKHDNPNSPIIPNLRKSIVSCLNNCTIHAANYLFTRGYFVVKYHKEYSPERLIAIMSGSFELDQCGLLELVEKSLQHSDKLRLFLIIIMYAKTRIIGPNLTTIINRIIDILDVSLDFSYFLLHSSIGYTITSIALRLYNKCILNSTKEQIDTLLRNAPETRVLLKDFIMNELTKLDNIQNKRKDIEDNRVQQQPNKRIDTKEIKREQIKKE